MGPAVWVTFSNCYKQWWKVALSYCIRDTDREIGTDYQLLHMAIDWDNRRHIYEKKKKEERTRQYVAERVAACWRAGHHKRSLNIEMGWLYINTRVHGAAIHCGRDVALLL